MQPRTALAVAVATGLLAVGLVAADLQLGLEAQLQSRDGSGWRTVSRAGGDPDSYAYPMQCAGQDLRLVVHNGRLLSTSQRVVVTYYGGASGGPQTLLDETWDLKAGERRTAELRVPDSAFASATDHRPGASLDARVGDLALGTCVEEGA